MVWRQPDGTGIGDNVALAQHVCGVDFHGALALLLGQPAHTAIAPPERVTTLCLQCGSDADKLAGQKYLAGRGITRAAMTAAEECGMLQYICCAVLIGRLDADMGSRSGDRIVAKGRQAGEVHPHTL